MVTLLLVVLAATAGHGPGRVVLVGAAVLAGQLSIGWLNDALDAGRDAAVGRGDKPVVSGAVTVTAVRTAALAAGTACVPLSLALGWPAGVAHLVAVAAGWAYDLGLKSTTASVVPYLVCFGLLRPWWCSPCPAPPPPRGGWSRAARCSARARTSPTSCPTSTTTPPPASAACRTGSAGPRAPPPRPC
jgi:hypothetical protein